MRHGGSKFVSHAKHWINGLLKHAFQLLFTPTYMWQWKSKLGRCSWCQIDIPHWCQTDVLGWCQKNVPKTYVFDVLDWCPKYVPKRYIFYFHWACIFDTQLMSTLNINLTSNIYFVTNGQFQIKVGKYNIVSTSDAANIEVSINIIEFKMKFFICGSAIE